MPSIRGHLLGALLLLSPLSSAAPTRKAPKYATLVNRQWSNATYDFIIAGGGIAGLTLADRLTEDPNVSVLVIEAGPFDWGQEGILVPGIFQPWWFFWPNLVSTPEPGLNNRQVGAITGQVVGGGSAINAMVYVRGDTEDYDAWGALQEDSTLSWNDMLPYFLKSETFTEPDAQFAQDANITWNPLVRGSFGPVQYTYPQHSYPGGEVWYNAANAVGLPHIEDPLAGHKAGVFPMPSVLDAATGTRSYAKVNHYDRVSAARPNYHILPSNMVSKVIFREDCKTVRGVEYVPTAGGNATVALASREVILAAGGFNTPKVLQLSGIGPKPLLDKFGIKVISNLPGVGQNLQDQPTLTVPLTFTNNLEPNSNSLNTDPAYAAEQYALYQSDKKGAFTVISSLGTNIAGVSLKQATPDFLDIVAAARAANPADSLPADVDPTVLAGYEAQREIIISQFENENVSVGNLHWGTSDNALVYHLRPLSRGSVNIVSTDPLVNPEINFRTATDPIDQAVYTALFRKNRELFATPEMQALGPAEASPFAEAQTDAEIDALLRDNINPTNAHQCCTAAMMPKSLGGVVDAKQQVYGVSGLRVADISFWPFQTGGSPLGTIYAAAERLADIIKAEYGISSL
ncbi:putative GMC oxidoreductase [Podospora fimiseda]|uniref:GMC oxidoreductase n=1 Tax=Podospora fimiseda TaxID=252190 RepID=A0AAN7BTB8_9PEZI|nr:putative GMC oxidoreductase [Podospora fimiseda]